MVVMTSDGTSLDPPSLRLGFPPPSHRDATTPSPCWAPHFMTQERIMFSNPTPSDAPLSRRDDERCHAIVSHSVLALRLYLAAYNMSLEGVVVEKVLRRCCCRFSVLDHLCSDLSQLFHPILLPCALAFPPPSHLDTTLSSCWVPHFMTQERIMFSNPTPSEPRLSPAATIDATTSSLTPPLHCASILQPAAPPQVVDFESWTISAPICLNQLTFAESQKSDL